MSASPLPSVFCTRPPINSNVIKKTSFEKIKKKVPVFYVVTVLLVMEKRVVLNRTEMVPVCSGCILVNNEQRTIVIAEQLREERRRRYKY